MIAARQWFTSRFAHPRLAALLIAGTVLLAIGGTVWILAPRGNPLQVTGFRLVIVGYLLTLVGGTGYLSFAAFEFRDRNLR